MRGGEHRQRLRARLALGTAALALLGPGALLATARAQAGSSTPAQSGAFAPAQSGARIGVWGQGSWSWFGDPRAVHIVGRYDQTYVGWIDWVGNVTIGAYDPRFGWLRSHVVGRLSSDDHSTPSILVEPDKRLTVFYSGHNGTEMYFRSTLRPEDISAWGPVEHLSARVAGRDGYTYPNPVVLPAERNRLYLFWRGGDYSADYATRTMDGRWSRGRKLVSAPGQRPYVKVDSNGRDGIVFGFTDGHPRERVASIFYAAYRDGALWSAAGRRISLLANAPIRPRQADVVYDGQRTGISSWVWDVALDRQARPVILYATFPTPARHKYWYARWTGRRWVSHFLTSGGPSISPATIEQQYSAGMTLDHADPSILYLARKVHGWFEIEKWTTSDGGSSWHHRTVVPGDGVDNARPVVPRGWDGGPMGLLWLRGPYNSYTTYRTSIAFLR